MKTANAGLTEALQSDITLKPQDWIGVLILNVLTELKGNNFQPYEGELHMDKMQIWNVVSEDGDIRCTSSRLST